MRPRKILRFVPDELDRGRSLLAGDMIGRLFLSLASKLLQPSLWCSFERMKSLWPPVVAFAFSTLCVKAAEVSECRWAVTPPVIDGRLDEAVWQHAQVITSFQSAWLPEGHRKPPTSTKARLLWDRDYLYFSAEM